LLKSGKAKLETYFASAQLLYECWVSFEIQQGFQQIYGMWNASISDGTGNRITA
jgi:predicted component of viral defense system (DUF524 family)